MELWIRTQEHGLSKIVDILPISDNRITAYSINGRCMLLGTYKTKERALEVFYEIKKFITINENINGSYEDVDMKLKALILKYSIRIYNMPQE